MNLYFRYFANEVLVSSEEELFQYIENIPEIHITPEMRDDVHRYIVSETPFPKRYKVRPRVYFILIKTVATNMEEFKKAGKGKFGPHADNYEEEGLMQAEDPREQYATYTSRRYGEGWYEGTFRFKRVVQNVATGKCSYEDTTFAAYVWAGSPAEVYDRITGHLKSRPDVDSRSQFPSMRGGNFQVHFLGDELPEDVTNEGDQEPND